MSDAFLRVPPFPRARGFALSVPDTDAAPLSEADLPALAEHLAEARVGGAFWASWPSLPKGRDLLLAPGDRDEAAALLDQALAEGVRDRAVLLGRWGQARAMRHAIPTLRQPTDPWHWLREAGTIWAGPRSELALVAALAGREARVIGAGPRPLTAALQQALGGKAWRSPFTGAGISLAEAIAILARWRVMIDANRVVAAILGIARWKRPTLDALLWPGGGSRASRYRSRLPKNLGAKDRVLAWAARTPRAALMQAQTQGCIIGEIEDGFIRSSGLGAHCVPPLSVVIDPAGSHIDPSRPSRIEDLLRETDFSPALLARAGNLRARLVAGGIGKYGGAAETTPLSPTSVSTRRRVLVCGQVEDDRAVLLGGAGMSNRLLLERARAAEPDAELIWRPHPDVEAGHRRGAIPAEVVRACADRIERHRPIATLFAEVDAVHVISSLAGFEALLRGRAVTTHGLPFYAGWGLTTDLAVFPARLRAARGRALPLDALVAAVLILLPRYLDPVSRLPCEAELLVARLAAGEAVVPSPLVPARIALGHLRRFMAAVLGG